LVEEHWFTAVQADYLGAANLAGYLIGAIFASRMAHRWRTAVLLRSSMAATSASFLACVMPSSFAWFAFWRLAAGIAGAVLMVLTVPALLRLTEPHRRGRMAGVMFTGVGAGIALAGTLIPVLVRWSLAAAWATLGLAAALLTVLTWRYWPPEPAPSPAFGETSKTEPLPAATVVFLMLAYGATAAAFAPHTIFWVDYLARGLGLGLTSGGRYWVLLGIGAATGPFLLGTIADRASASRTVRGALLTMSACVALPLVSSHWAALAASSMGTGAMVLGISALMSNRVTQIVPPTAQKAVWGWMTVMFSLSYAGGAYLFSYLYARNGSYRIVFAIGAIVVLTGSAFEALSARAERRIVPALPVKCRP
jgi:predicted MFS family arabinose efflux permease